MKTLGTIFTVMLIPPAWVALQVCTIGLLFALLTPVALFIMVPATALTVLALITQFRASFDLKKNKKVEKEKIEIIGCIAGLLVGASCFIYMLSQPLEYINPDFVFLASGAFLMATSISIPIARFLQRKGNHNQPLQDNVASRRA